MAGPNLSEREPHSEAEELLPWYANGQLDEADRSRVEKHLSSCAFCRRQLALERQLIDEFRAMAPEIESGWARLRQRVQARIPKRQRRAGPLAGFWGFITRPAVAGFAAAQLAFVIASGAVLLSLSRPVYHTLGSAPVPVSANIIVMFRADATIEDVRGTLKSAGASIVDGPTTADAYLLHVAPQQRQRALAKLQSDDNVQMAQAIDGAAS
jgi:hypothetical protein